LRVGRAELADADDDFGLAVLGDDLAVDDAIEVLGTGSAAAPSVWHRVVRWFRRSAARA
jgi:hypothetical protein